MWSLGKVIGTPEVLRVYIGSFWEQPFHNTDNAALFEAETKDLLADLRSLPRNSAVRKVNELVKRARQAKVHAYMLSHLRSRRRVLFPLVDEFSFIVLFPLFLDQFGWFGKEKTQKKLIDGLAMEYRRVQQQFNLPKGDFPNIRKFKDDLTRFELHKFPKLDEAMMKSLDEALSHGLTLTSSLVCERIRDAKTSLEQIFQS